VNDWLHGTDQRVDTDFFYFRALTLIGIDCLYTSLLIAP
jgi:hypothetical protein